MAITVPKFYPRPWAADEQLPELTQGEMVTAFPGGTEQRPTRQTLNRALQYATNGIIYFLTHGIPEWSAEVQYAVGSIVRNQNTFLLAIAPSDGAPDGATIMWEPLPWRKDALDAIYMTMEFGDAHFLSFANADERFYPKAQMDALFITPSKMALLYVTQAALAAEYITREQAVSMFLTVAIADERYAIYEETVSAEVLAEMLEEYLSIADGKELYLTLEDETHLTRERGAAIYLTPEDALARFEAKINAAISRYRPEAVYGFGVLAFDPEERTIYRSLADDNVGHPLDDEEYWTEWTIPHKEPTGAGEWAHRLTYTERGTYSLTLGDLLVPGVETHGEILTRFRLKAGGGSGYGVGGGGEGAEITVVAVMEESAFPLGLVVGGPGQQSSVISNSANSTPVMVPINCGFVIPTIPASSSETEWGEDRWWTGGFTQHSPDVVVDTSRVIRPAPMEVYQRNRHGNFNTRVVYTIPPDVAIPGTIYHLRLHFAENWVPQGRASVNIVVNGRVVRENFNIAESAGGMYIAYIVEVDAMAENAGLVLTFSETNPVFFDPIICGIEVFPVTTLLSVSPGSDANDEGPGLGGDQATVALGRGLMAVEKIPGAHGKFAWPGFRSGDGGGAGGGSGMPLRTINCGGDVVGAWGVDTGYQGGGGLPTSTYNIPDSVIDMSRVLRPAPMEIYQSARYITPTNTLSYNVLNFAAPFVLHVIRFHFCEHFVEVAGQRVFHIRVNLDFVLENFDIFAAAGGARIANVQTFVVQASQFGQFNIGFWGVTDAPQINGIEIFPVLPMPSGMAPINCGAALLGEPGWEDRWYTGGNVTATDAAATIDISRVVRPAPDMVYRTCRFGGGGTPPPFSYRISPPTVTPGWIYRLRLHFCECWDESGSRSFDVAVNNRWIARNFNVFERAGGQFIAYILETDVTANAEGLHIWFEAIPPNAGVDPILCGIEMEYLGLPVMTRVYGWNAGGPALADWMSDAGAIFTAGSGFDWMSGEELNMSRPNLAPRVIYDTIRFDTNWTLTLPLEPDTEYIVRLHFVDDGAGGPPRRAFNITFNGVRVATNFSPEGIAGLRAALAVDYRARSDSNGNIVVLFETVAANATLSGCEVFTTVATGMHGGGGSSWFGGEPVGNAAEGFITVDW